MGKSLNILALAGLAAAAAQGSYQSEPAVYGSSSASTYTSETVSTPAGYTSETVSTPAGYTSETVSTPAGYTSETVSSPAGYGSSTTTPAGYESTSTPTVYGSTTSTAPYTTITPSSSALPSCWSTCFASAGITSESALCGNTEVDACIQEGCSAEEDEAYWTWYDEYCPSVTSSSTTTTGTITGYTTTSAVIPSATANCWDTCFAKYDITDESALCGNSAVSACIYETCSSELDQAYWTWYDDFCQGEGVTTVTYTTSGTAYDCSTFSTVWSSGETTATSYWTSTYGSTSGTYTTTTESWVSAPTGWYPTTTATGGYATATGTGAASVSAYVPATGAGSNIKPAAALFGGVVALAALL